MKLDKYIVTTVIFILFIGYIGIATFWNNKEEFISIVKSGDVINKTNQIYAENVAHSDFFIDLWSQTQSASNATLLDDAEYGVIVKDSLGSLYFPVAKKDVTNQAQSLVNFSKIIKEKNTPFVYIQAPNKVIEGYTEDIVYEHNFANENADEFLKMLEINNVDALDLRENMAKSDLEKESLFYKTDHHWTTKTAFWAYKEAVSYLNEKYDLKIDKANFYTDINNYNVQTLEKCFLGSLGRRVGKSVAGLDDYDFISPKFETDYELFNGVSLTDSPIFSGSFNNAIVKNKILNSTDVLDNKHATYFEWDYGDLIIKNKLVDNDIKILLIKDSYALPFAAFLSTAVSEVRMIDLRDSPKADLKTILEEEKFDTVMVMYNAEAVDVETMFEFGAF